MAIIMLRVRGDNLVNTSLAHCVPLAGVCRGFSRAFRSDEFWAPYYAANLESVRRPAIAHGMELPMDEEATWTQFPSGLHAQYYARYLTMDTEGGVCRFCGTQSTMMRGEVCRLCSREGDSLFIDRKTCLDEFMITQRQFNRLPKFCVVNLRTRNTRTNCAALSAVQNASAERWGSLRRLRLARYRRHLRTLE